jgi:adenosylhomocysteine nucleosidase
LILIFYAFAREIAPFKRRLKNRRALEHRDLRGFRAEAGNTEIIAIATGVGMKRAREAARRAFEEYSAVKIAIGTGVAGALAAELAPGDLVIADRVMAHRSAEEEPQHLATIEEAVLDEFGSMLRAAGMPYSSGAILTSHRVLPGSAEKRRARETTGAIVVDMETASIAEEALAREIPFVCMRAIIDEVDDQVIGPRLDKEGNIRALATAVKVLRNPGDLLKLPQMMKNLGRATKSLADALEVVTREARRAESAK